MSSSPIYHVLTDSELTALPPLQGVDPHRIHPILAACPLHDLTAGQCLLEPGQPPQSLYLLVHGALQIRVGAANSECLATLTPGDWVGERLLIEAVPTATCVIAAEPSRVLAVSVPVFWELVGVAPLIAQRLMTGFAERWCADPESPAREAALKGAHDALQQAYRHLEAERDRLQKQLVSRRWILRSALIAFGVISIDLSLNFGLTRTITATGSGLTRFFNGGTRNTPPTQDAQFPTVTVSPREVTDWLRLRGTVQPTRWVEVTAPISSVVTRLDFQFGQLVEKGQALAELNSDEQRTKQRDAYTRYIKAQQEVTRLRHWNDSPEVRRARRDVSQAQAALKEAQRTLDGSRRLFEKGIVSEDELRQNQASLSDRRTAIATARESLTATLKQGSDANVRIAELELENAQQALAHIERQLALTTVHSPTTGIIFPSSQLPNAGNTATTSTQKPLLVGSPVSANGEMFAIADMQGIALESEVSEDEVLKLALRQPATLVISALPGVALPGSIDFIARRGSADSRGSVAFQVRAVVAELTADQRRALRLGMSAEARVQVYHKADALVVPFAAITVKGRDYSVQVVGADGSVQRRRIRIRATLVDGVEVSAGLKAGERLRLSES